MKFFKKKTQNFSAVQTAPANFSKSHPFTEISNYTPGSNYKLKLYKAIKEAIPIIDAAISKIIRLTGEFSIKCENKEIEAEINNFVNSVQVNSCSCGVNAFILSHLNQLLTYGTAVGEIVINSEGTKIDALYNASLDNLELLTDTNPLKLKIFRKNKKGQLSEIKYPELILISTLNPEPGQIYGNSILKGLPFISDILLKIYNSIGTNWERVGNVRFAVTYKPSSEAGEKAYTKERASLIASEWSKAMKNSLQPSDFIAIGDVSIKAIGADNPILDSQVPVRQMLEQIISKLSIPPFLLGLSWSTTETMSAQQSEILSSELDSYRRILNPIIYKICNMWLRLKGYDEKIEINWEMVDLSNQLDIANTKLINAKTLEIEKRLENSEQPNIQNL